MKEDIVEGLRLALARGEPLQKAMMTFYNSGYLKEDIEAAARELQNPSLPIFNSQPTKPSTPIPKQTIPPSKLLTSQVSSPSPPSKPVSTPLPPSQTPSSPKPEEKKEEFFDIPSPQTPFSETKIEDSDQKATTQKVSNYGSEKPSRLGAVLIFVLVLFLLVLIGALIGMFLFKEELTVFFNGFFG